MASKHWQYKAYRADGTIYEGVAVGDDYLKIIVEVRQLGLQIYDIQTISPMQYAVMNKIIKRIGTPVVGKVGFLTRQVDSVLRIRKSGASAIEKVEPLNGRKPVPYGLQLAAIAMAATAAAIVTVYGLLSMLSRP